MRANRRNRCDDIIALIDQCLADYDTEYPTTASVPSGRRDGGPAAEG